MKKAMYAVFFSKEIGEISKFVTPLMSSYKDALSVSNNYNCRMCEELSMDELHGEYAHAIFSAERIADFRKKKGGKKIYVPSVISVRLSEINFIGAFTNKVEAIKKIREYLRWVGDRYEDADTCIYEIDS